MLLCALASCGGGGGRLASGGSANYAPPGPEEDPWGPYIAEASRRFDVPQTWIRAVMRQESGGHQYLHGQPITSDAGAAGLMQLMPATYAELRDQYGLGSDPYAPHDNIMAGTAYIKQMYDRFGSPAFLAAYNAGPNRVDAYMAGKGGLPNETVNYLASIAPRLGNEHPMTGPLAAYADNGGAPLTPDPVPKSYARAPLSKCWRDPDAAYDPDAPCRSIPMRAPVQIAAASPRPTTSGSVLWGQGQSAPIPPPRPGCWHDPDAAYDPSAPCQRRPQPVQVAEAPEPAPAPVRHDSFLIPTAAAATLPLPRNYSAASGRWAIQVGAFSNPDQARRVAESVRDLAPRELSRAQTVLGTTAPFGGQVLYRARLAGLSAATAASACGQIAAQRQACVTVPPGG